MNYRQQLRKGESISQLNRLEIFYTFQGRALQEMENLPYLENWERTERLKKGRRRQESAL